MCVPMQVLSGGRGLGHFSNGFKSGVHMCNKYVALNNMQSTSCRTAPYTHCMPRKLFAARDGWSAHLLLLLTMCAHLVQSNTVSAVIN
jgi:hypothetical protein